MKPRLMGVLTILALSISATAMPVSAAVKAGAKCKVVGQTKIKKQKEFICITKGKKLVWSKGLKVVVKATPTPSSTPTNSYPVITAGAFCTPAGAMGQSSKGVIYTCKTSATDSRNRWRQ